MSQESHRASGFTLVELLLAMSVLTVLLLLLTSLLSAVNRAWVAGEQQTSEFQDGRAILEIIGRELSQATISPTLQFVQNPALAPGLKIRANSDSIFWLAPSTSTARGSLAEIGYYLTEDPNATGATAYQLKRFFVPPTDSNNYQVFSPANRPTDYSATWVTAFVTEVLSAPVASGVLAFWVRCLDTNGEAIPWLSTSATGVGPLKFNSAAHFQPANPGEAQSFRYTDAARTARADLLPTMVELTIVMLDERTFRRAPQIPSQTSPSSPHDVAAARDSFNQQLISNGIRNARTFTTRIRMLNSK